MKHLSIPTLLPAILLAISLLVAGCNKELLTEDSNSEQGIQLCLNIDGMGAVSAGGITRATIENTVKDLWILQYQMNGTSTTDGTLMSKTYIANVNDASKIIYRPLPGDNMALYLIANGSSLMNIEIGKSLETLKNDYLAVTTKTGSTFPYQSSTHLTMVGQSATKKFTLGEQVPVTLTRIMAKIDLTIKNMFPTGYPQLTLQSVQLKSVPNRATLRPIYEGGGNYPTVNNILFDNYESTVITNNSQFSTTYYLSPNIRGVNTNVTHESQKNATKAPTAYATYIEIIGKAKASANSPEVDVIYRLYPGANNTTNYNIEANTAYKIDIELTGINATDTRMHITTGKFDLMGGVDGEHQDNINGWNRPGIGYYYYTDGTYSAKLNSEKTANGIIYYVDPDDPRWFKVMALGGLDVAEPQWSATTTYEIGVGARSLADGKGNAAAVKAYFEENKGGIVTQTTFSSAFNAHAWCYDHKGKGNDAPGTWHMPARDELQYLYCAYNGIYPPKTWTGTISGSNSTNRGTWNGLLTAAGGTGITTTDNVRIYWTSTEISISAAYGIHMETSGITSSVKNNWPNHLRCVRNIAPPPVVGDYYYTDGTYSKELKSGKTANGIVFYVDPTRFKVMALDQGSAKSWSAKYGYVINSTEISILDGRINIVAGRKYSKDHVTDTNEKTKTTGVLLTDFPLMGYCYEYQGKNNSDSKGTWYMPARNELQYLFCAYNGVAPVTWETTQKGYLNPQANTTWDARLTGVSGTAMTKNHYWTSSQAWSNTAWSINFGDGEVKDNFQNTNMLNNRCIREIKR